MRTLLTLAAVVLAIALPAQGKPETRPQGSKVEAALKEARARLATLGDPKTQEAKDWKAAVSLRVAVLEELLRTRKEHQALLPLQEIKARKDKVTSDLDAQREQKPPASVSLASPEGVTEYEQRFQKAQGELDACERILDSTTKKQQRAQGERQGLSDRKAKAKALSERTDDDDVSRYRVATAHWEQQAVAAREAYLTDGFARWPALVEVLHMERDLARLRAERADELLAAARKQAAVLREAEAAAAREKAAKEATAAKHERDPLEGFRRGVLSDIAELQAAISTTKTELDDLKAQITDVKQSCEALTQEKDRLDDRLAAYQRQADVVLRRTLTRVQREQERVVEVALPACQAATRRNLAQLGDVLDRLWNLSLPDEDNKELQQLMALPAAAANPDRAKAIYQDVVNGSDGLLAVLNSHKVQLRAAATRYGELNALLNARRELLEGYIEFIGARLFWTKTEDAVSLALLGSAWDELPGIANPYAEAALWSDTREALERSPLYGIGLGLIALLVVASLFWRFRPRPKAVAAAATEAAAPAVDATPEATPEAMPATTPTGPTFGVRCRAVLGTLAAAAVVPAALGIAILLLRRLHLAPALEMPLTQALTVIAWVVLSRGLANRLLREDGVAIRFLGVTADVAAQLLGSIRLITLAALVFYLPLSILEASPFKLAGLPRLLETGWFVCATLAMIMVARYRGPVVQRWTKPDGFARQVWRVVGPLFVVCLIAVMVLHLGGYRNGAVHLMGNLAKTFVALFALGAAFKMFTVVSGRAIDAIASRRARTKEAGEEELQASIEAARRLTDAVGILAVVIAAFLLGRFWGFGTPLMAFLEDLDFLEIDKVRGLELTALDVFKALLWVIGGHFIARNIGRIYDSLVTGRGEAGGRFALITLVRYLVIVVAYTCALLALEINLTTLGWMATAASVGLGFGLQEIVANFISGLILLFERPVRVGDIIAVGETSGIVDRITIRSTYVTNWERQTFIVPNKNFVTQNVINWTRTDQVMRRVLQVGVAYGSDVDKVRKILSDVCNENPRVLRDPPHRIWFKGFGEYRLEFTIWVFTNISFGFPTMTELYTEIYKRLREAGIEIPVPRRDVFVHGEGRFPTPETMPGADAPVPIE